MNIYNILPTQKCYQICGFSVKLGVTIQSLGEGVEYFL